MIKPHNFLGGSFSILGTAFFVLTIIFIFTSDIQTGSSIVIYQYRPLVAPALITGLIFFNTGIFFIWKEYLISEQRKRVKIKLAAQNIENKEE